MPEWKKEVTKVGRKTWIDWVWGKYRLEQGRDNHEARAGRPWLLTKRVKDAHKRIDAFETLEGGKEGAELREAERLNKEVNRAIESVAG